MSLPVKMIILTGTMGSGKTTAMAEASDLLTAAGVVHAAIDLDTLGVTFLPEESTAEIEYRNLASVWSNYRTAGVARLLISAAVESKADLDRILKSIPGAGELVVCRLKVDLTTARERVRNREPGMWRERFVARVDRLENILDDAKLEHFSFQNDAGQITEVARQILRAAKWI